LGRLDAIVTGITLKKVLITVMVLGSALAFILTLHSFFEKWEFFYQRHYEVTTLMPRAIEEFFKATEEMDSDFDRIMAWVNEGDKADNKKEAKNRQHHPDQGLKDVISPKYQATSFWYGFWDFVKDVPFLCGLLVMAFALLVVSIIYMVRVFKE